MTSFRNAVLLAATLLSSATGLAQPASLTVNAWVEACRQRLEPSRKLTRVYAWESGFVVEVATETEPLRIELSAEPRGRFVETAELGLSPVGEFAEWDDQPADMKRALEEIEACAAALGAPRWPGPALPTTEPDRPPPDPPAPWVPLAALLATAVVVWYRRSKLHPRDALAAMAVAATVGLYWWLALPSGFFHQNGHGPTWVLYTVRGHTGLERYGPGFPWLWSWLTHLNPPRADVLVLCGQFALGLTGVVASFVVARRQLASPAAAAALALAAASALLGRVVQSESYFGSIASLLWISAAVASLARDHEVRSRRFRGLCCLAGLWAGLAASIHPVGWVPASLVVLTIPSLRDSWATTKRQLVHGTFWFGVICLGVAASSIAATFESGLGGQWTARLSGVHGAVLVLGGIAATVILRRSRHSERALHRAQLAVAAALPLVVAYGTFVLQAERLAFTLAFVELHKPAVFAALAAGLVLVGEHRRVWAGVIGLGLVASLATLPVAREVPTDVEEATWASTWRSEVSPDHPVVWLSRAGLRNVDLPLYDDRRRPMDAADFRAIRVPSGTTYYRSSLCSTVEGRMACREFEERHALEPLAEREMPAVPSRPEIQPYETEKIAVGVFRVN